MTIELPERMTIGDGYPPAMKITTQSEADEYFQALVDRQMRYFKRSLAEAQSIERNNLGYYAGYYDHETRLRVEKLFRCHHPILGRAENGAPTDLEALNAGRNVATKEGEKA